MSALGVRRDKAALSSGCKSHPATAPAGSNRSSHGGNEVAVMSTTAGLPSASEALLQRNELAESANTGLTSIVKGRSRNDAARDGAVNARQGETAPQKVLSSMSVVILRVPRPEAWKREARLM
jgi:hypothetical protein